MARIKFNSELAKEILKGIAATTAVVGLTVGLAVMPGMGRVVKELLDLYQKANRKQKFKIRKTFADLRKARLIDEIELPDGSTRLVLSEKGNKQILKFNFEDLRMPKSGKWDGKWRFVIFDLPERYKRERDLFRYKLKTMGFYQVNRSVWLNAHPCKREIDFVSEYLRISAYVRVIEALDFDGREELEDFFGV